MSVWQSECDCVCVRVCVPSIGRGLVLDGMTLLNSVSYFQSVQPLTPNKKVTSIVNRITHLLES